MGRVIFKPHGRRPQVQRMASPSAGKTAEEVVRQLKADRTDERWTFYRERSLAIHGPVCARCGREFSGANLRLLTVHHKDGNHSHNPPDGSNWENLCVYCHEDTHSRELLGEFYASQGDTESELDNGDSIENTSTSFTSLGEIIQHKLARKQKK